MQPYQNLNGNSGVLAYQAGKDYIDVRFNDGKIYRYSYILPGKHHVEEMKRRAQAGRGLATYINQHVRDNYEAKIA